MLDSVPTDGSIPLNINLQLALFIIAPSIISFELFKNNTRGFFFWGGKARLHGKRVGGGGGVFAHDVIPETDVLQSDFMAGRGAVC